MSIEALSEVLGDIGVETDDITADLRLRADLGLDSVETTELELELARRFEVRVDLWDTTDYSIGELAALVVGARPAPSGRAPTEFPRVPPERARAYREAGWWRPELLDAVLLRHAEREPGKCALVAGERRLTYGELAATVEGLAGRLRGLGIGPGDPVVVQLPNTVEYVALVLALLRIGAPPVLAVPTLGEYELDRILGLTAPVAVAVPGRNRRSDPPAMVRRLRLRHPSIAHLLVAGGSPDGPDVVELTRSCAPDKAEDTGGSTGPSAAGGNPAGSVKPGDAALFLLSSGTTGPPKLMARTHEDYGYVVRATSAVAGVSADTVYLAVLPGTHTFVLAYPGIMGTLAAGGTVVLGSAEDPRRALELIQRERVTHTAAVPGVVTQWLGVLRTDHYDTGSLAVLQVGGARLDAPVAAQARATLSCVVQQVYGMSEGLANYTRLDDPDEVTFTTQGRPASPGDEVLIVDDNEQPVPPGQIGQLLTRGPSTVAGYFRDAESTGRAFTRDGFYRTGDLVRRCPDGNLQVTGRIKNLINRGGEKVSAEELEELVRDLPQVAAAGAAPMPHPVYGETVCLFVVPADGASPELREIRQHLQSRGLARYKLPERLEHLDAMPVIGVGKLDRGALRERAAAIATLVHSGR
jgi:2,3-dihydroxybenzoate-AMP ligase